MDINEALMSEFECIFGQIYEDLLQPNLVAYQCLGQLSKPIFILLIFVTAVLLI